MLLIWELVRSCERPQQRQEETEENANIPTTSLLCESE